MSEISMTLSSTHIELQNGKGAISASVTNASQAPQQLILAAFDQEGPAPQSGEGTQAPTGTGSSSWVTVENAHRTIAAGKTEQFTVSFDGTGRTAGTHTVKLIAYSADENPEDNRGESATVTVVVPEMEQQKEDGKRRIPWWVWVAGAAVLLAIAALVFFLLPRDPEVPDVVGRPVGEAVSVLAENDFRVAADFEYVSSDRPVDTVLEQEPAAGTTAEAGSTVSLTLAAPRTAEVPGVVGQRVQAAAELITASGLRPLFPPGVPCSVTQNPARCDVVAQFPAAGSEQRIDSEVVLFTEVDEPGPRPTFEPPCRPWPRCIVRDDLVLERVLPRGIDDRFLDEEVLDIRGDRFTQLGRQPR